MTIIPLHIGPEHPAYAGHFPGAPVLPGVVLLDAAVLSAGDPPAGSAHGWQIASVKFQSAVRPGEALLLARERLEDGSVRFIIRCAGRMVASGTFVLSNPAATAGAGEARCPT